MICPTCKNINLVMSDRQGVEIDYCPQCRGVWLDRGELDKIIDRSAATPSPASAPVQAPAQRMENTPQSYQQKQHYSKEYEQDGYYKKKKRESFLSDIFDF